MYLFIHYTFYFIILTVFTYMLLPLKRTLFNGVHKLFFFCFLGVSLHTYTHIHTRSLCMQKSFIYAHIWQGFCKEIYSDWSFVLESVGCIQRYLECDASRSETPENDGPLIIYTLLRRFVIRRMMYIRKHERKIYCC